MKKWINSILVMMVSISIFVGVARAQQLPSVSQSTADFEKVFKSAVYSVRTIPDILKDLNDADTASGYAISKNMMVEIYNRFEAAATLISLILVDPKLTERQRHELSGEMTAAIGEIFETGIRQQGEDKVKTVKKIADMNSLEKAKAALREVFVLDIKNAFSFLSSARSAKEGGAEHIWGPIARLQKNELGERLILRMQQFAREVIPQLESQKAEVLQEAIVGEWKENLAQKAIDIRERRVGVQKLAAATYLGMAAWGLMAPHFDFVGNLMTGVNDFTLFTSSIVYAVGWTAVSYMKWATVSTKSVKMLKDLQTLLDNPRAVIQAENSKFKIKDLFSKISESARIDKLIPKRGAKVSFCHGAMGS
jgi:hypothetical protein